MTNMVSVREKAEDIRRHALKVRKEYEDNLLKHEMNSAEAVHWVGKDKAWMRFKLLAEIDDLTGRTVLDFGCGNALFLDYLIENNITCRYHGWDISDKMIDVARSRHPQGDFSVVDVMDDDLAQFHDFFDYIIISGVFHIKKDSPHDLHERWVEASLVRLWPLCRKGIGVNFMTEHVQWRDSDLYYSSVGDIGTFCAHNLSRWFVLRHDSRLWEFTLYIYREPRL